MCEDVLLVREWRVESGGATTTTRYLEVHSMIREVFGVAIESATCDWLASRYAAVEPSLAHQHTSTFFAI
jgi:hypothetical protein